MVTAKDAQLSSIPADSGGKRTKLAEGTPVDICGESGNFVRVEGENISGWMKKNEVTGIFIYDLFTSLVSLKSMLFVHICNKRKS